MYRKLWLSIKWRFFLTHWAPCWWIVVNWYVLNCRYLCQLDGCTQFHRCIMRKRARMTAEAMPSKCCLGSKWWQWISLSFEIVPFFAEFPELSNIVTKPLDQQFEFEISSFRRWFLSSEDTICAVSLAHDKSHLFGNFCQFILGGRYAFLSYSCLWIL